MRLVDINVFVKFRPALNGAVLSWSDSMNILVRKRPVSPAEYAQANDRTIQQPVRDPESPGGRPEPDRPRFLERMAVKLHDRIVIVRFQDVLWFQSKGNLLRLHLDQNFCRGSTLAVSCALIAAQSSISIMSWNSTCRDMANQLLVSTTAVFCP
jgi:hypothetical protein